MAIYEITVGNFLAVSGEALSVFNTTIKALSVTSTLGLNGASQSRGNRYISVGNILNLSNANDPTPFDKITNNDLDIQNEAELLYIVKTTRSNLHLSHYAARTYFFSLLQNIGLTHIARNYPWQVYVDPLALYQSVDVVKNYNSVLELEQTLDLLVRWSRSLTQSIGLQSNIAYYLIKKHFSVINVPDYNPNHSVSFTDSLETITLRTPDFGDTIGLEQNRVNRRSRGRDLIIYRDDIWPRRDVLKWNFQAIRADLVTRLKDFLYRNAGKLIDIEDYEGNVIQGMILNPNTEFAEITRTCGYSFTLEIEI